jgi:opacity protein-like surface antigen
MLKRAILPTVIVILLSPVWIEAGVFSRLSFSLCPAGFWSLHGRYDGSYELRDMMIPGAGFGLNLRYEINNNILVDAGYSFNWMYMKESRQPAAYDDDKPAFVLPMYTLSGTFFLASGGLRPYLTFGGGVCSWKFSTYVAGGDTFSAPENASEEFSKTSLVLNAGLGAELFLWPKLSVLAEVKYLFLFTKDAEKFGTEIFGNQGVLGFTFGICYYFERPGRSSVKASNREY